MRRRRGSREDPRRRARADRRAARPSRSSSSRRPGRARCSSVSPRAASATPTTTRSTARRRRAARPCSGTRGPASSRPSARASPASRRRPRRPVVGAVLRRLRRVPARACRSLCSTAWPAMGTGGLMDGTTRLSRGGEPVFHYSFLSTFAEACVVPERSCVPIPKDVPFDDRRARGLRRHDRRRRGLANGRRAARRPRRRDRVRRRRAVCPDGGGGRRRRACRCGRRRPVEAGRRPLVRGDRPPCSGPGRAEATAELVREVSGGGVDYAIEATGRPEAMTAAFLSTRARGAAVLIGIPQPTPRHAARAVDPAPRAAGARLDLRLVPAGARLRHHARCLPLGPAAARPADLAPAAARRDRAGLRADAQRRRPSRRTRPDHVAPDRPETEESDEP